MHAWCQLPVESGEWGAPYRAGAVRPPTGHRPACLCVELLHQRPAGDRGACVPQTAEKRHSRPGGPRGMGGGGGGGGHPR
jgi:hypothetical protein